MKNPINEVPIPISSGVRTAWAAGVITTDRNESAIPVKETITITNHNGIRGPIKTSPAKAIAIQIPAIEREIQEFLVWFLRPNHLQVLEE